MDRKTLKAHRAIIDEIGTEKLMEVTEMTRQAIGHWRNRGIPRAWFLVLKNLQNEQGNKAVPVSSAPSPTPRVRQAHAGGPGFE